MSLEPKKSVKKRPLRILSILLKKPKTRVEKEKKQVAVKKNLGLAKLFLGFFYEFYLVFMEF